jgi:membrane protein involved in colicin uptake
MTPVLKKVAKAKARTTATATKAKAKAKEKARATATTRARATATATAKTNTGILHCVQNDGGGGAESCGGMTTECNGKSKGHGVGGGKGSVGLGWWRPSGSFGYASG